MLANLLAARAQGRSLPAFRYRDFGSMATIGRKRAVAQIGPPIPNTGVPVGGQASAIQFERDLHHQHNLQDA